jgi:hypothetical protein
MKPKRTTFSPFLSLLASVRRHGIITVWLFSTVDIADMIAAELGKHYVPVTELD